MWGKIKKKFNELVTFLKKVSQDERIPKKDKILLVTLIALVISPFDIIPDWIPLLGQLDDLIMLALILDYLFDHLDQDVLLSHYPWSMASYIRLRRFARFISWMTPQGVKHKIWSYKPSVYDK